MELNGRSFGRGAVVVLALILLLIFFVPGQTAGQATGIKESEITSIHFVSHFSGGKPGITAPYETVVTDRAKIAEFYQRFVHGYAMTPDNNPGHVMVGPNLYDIRLVLNHNEKDYVEISVNNLIMVGRYKRQDPSLDYVGQTDSEKEVWKTQNYQPGNMTDYLHELNTYVTSVDPHWLTHSL